MLNKLAYFTIILISLTMLSCGAGTVGQGAKVDSTQPVTKSGRLAENEVWSGNILVADDVIVPEGVTLTIQPGAIVGYSTEGKPLTLTVNGTLYAEGDEQERILFTSLTRDHQPGGWDGIVFGKSSLNSRLSFCIIQYHQQILCLSDSVNIADNVITSGGAAGIVCDLASPVVENNEMTKNEVAIKCLGDAAPEISRNLIQANTFGIICEDDATPNIFRNIISDNRQDGITCYGTAMPTITSNNILRNGGWAVYDGGRLSDNFIKGNNKAGPNVVDTGRSTTSTQYYGIDEIEQPRGSEVMEAGPHRRR